MGFGRKLAPPTCLTEATTRSEDVEEKKEAKSIGLLEHPEPTSPSTRDTTSLNVGHRTPGGSPPPPASSSRGGGGGGSMQIEEQIIVAQVMDSGRRLLPVAARRPFA